MNSPSYFALAAAASVFVSNIIYLASIRSGKTRPSIAALIVFSFSLGSAFFSSLSLGVSAAVLAAIGTNMALCFAALAYSLSTGRGDRAFGTTEKLFLAAIFSGILFWTISGSAWAALIIPTAVDAAGCLLVILKLRRDPGSENVSAWALAWLGYAISAAGIVHWQIQDILYSGSNIILCAAVAAISFSGQRRS